MKKGKGVPGKGPETSERTSCKRGKEGPGTEEPLKFC